MYTQNRFVKKKSAFTVQDTIDKLESILNDKGIAVFAKIDHCRNAREVGLELNESQVLFFGNPQIGTLLMQKNIFLSLDLPLKIAVVTDDSGDVWVTYTSAHILGETYNLPDSSNY